MLGGGVSGPMMRRGEGTRQQPCVDRVCSAPPPAEGSVLHLYFYYLINLNIMTVKTKVSTGTDLSTAISSGWVLCVCPLLTLRVCVSVCWYNESNDSIDCSDLPGIC